MGTGKPMYQIVWSDEFNYMGLPDTSKWYSENHPIPPAGNNKKAGMPRTNEGIRFKNARVMNGQLTIEMHEEDPERMYFSSVRLVSAKSFDQVPKKIQVKASLPDFNGIIPVIGIMLERWEGRKIVAYAERNLLQSLKSGILSSDQMIPGDISNSRVLAYAQQRQVMNEHNSMTTINFVRDDLPKPMITEDEGFYYFREKLFGEYNSPGYNKYRIFISLNIEKAEQIEEKSFHLDFPVKMEIDYIRIFS